MADIRIKDFPAGPFQSGERMGSDSDANGTRSFDVDAVIDGVLEDIHNSPDGPFSSGRKFAMDSTLNGREKIDVDDVTAGVLAEIRNQIVGTFTAGEKLVTDSAGNGTRQIDVQDIIDAYDAAIAAAIAAALVGYINTANNGLTESPAGNVQLGGDLIQNTIVGVAASGFTLDVLADIITAIGDNGVVVNTVAGDTEIDAAGSVKILGSTTPAVGDVLEATAVDGTAQWVTPTPPAYGEVGMNPGGPGTTFNIALAGTPVKWTGLTLGDFDAGGLVTFAADRFDINAGGDGRYRVSLSMGFDGDNDNYNLLLYKNGVLVPDIQMVRTIAGASEGSWSITGFVDMVATDFLEIFFDAGSNNRNLRVWYSNWNIERIDT
jgi:hypothetical protein